MRTIELSRGLLAVVDDADYEALSQYRWHAVTDRYGNHYAHRIERVDGRQVHVVMGRELLRVSSRAEIVKYRNGDTLDNRRENLLLRPRKKEWAVAAEREPALEASS